MIGNAQRDDRLYRRVDGITGLTTENCSPCRYGCGPHHRRAEVIK
jgi:hypothetical protein